MEKRDLALEWFYCLSLYSVELLNYFIWRGSARILTESRWLRTYIFVVRKADTSVRGNPGFHDLLPNSAPGVQMHLCISLTCRRSTTSALPWWTALPKRVYWGETNTTKYTLFPKLVPHRVRGESGSLDFKLCPNCCSPGPCEGCSTHMAAETAEIRFLPMCHLTSAPFTTLVWFLTGQWKTSSEHNVLSGNFPGPWERQDNDGVPPHTRLLGSQKISRTCSQCTW